MPFSHHRPALFLAAALALAACQHPQPAQRTPRTPTLETADPGVAVLAAVQNARAAIAAGDRLAAYNSVTLALSNAVQLTGSESTLFPPQAAPPVYQPTAGASGGGAGGGQDGPGGGSGHRHGGGHRSAGAGGAPPGPTPPSEAASNAASAPANGAASAPALSPQRHARSGGRAGGAAAAGQAEVTGFDAQVRLASIQTMLQTGDVAGADAGLGALEASAERQGPPADLPLVRADQCLTLARTAANNGRLAELQTLLQTARAALQAYDGRPHAAEAKALANAIGTALDRPGGVGALAPAELSLWSGRLSSWV